MKFHMYIVFLIYSACILKINAQWSNIDYEIFDIVSSLEETEGKGTTFYSFLDLKKGPDSRIDEINKAYRQKALELHPDKIKDKKFYKISQERFSKLGLIANILRNGESKERYDFFYKNGFPKWKGSGYYYSRYKPSFKFVLIILLIIFSSFQYVASKLNATRSRNRIKYYISSAIYAARGHNMTYKSNSGRKKVINQETGQTFIVEPDNSVYFINTDGTKWLLDVNNVPPARLKDTFIFVFLRFIWKHSIKRVYYIIFKNQNILKHNDKIKHK
ncbi:hypothetical protein T552_01595 [Pneumocystis carinii B80]|uniref:J domain-containing protein n=1 Tax=Pneumocystis carinii (strain B80) TaxID=1408658 RepID=A0A0W4ZKR8_PNEC8|nr:hypothetical protein T552_01595 [Pneumocystis carinii B80]KTW28965.1 hypothetical protein T552_01595 [Pneumocystis carinii B80]